MQLTSVAPVKTRRSWCKLEYDVDYYSGPDRQVTNIDISTTGSLPPPLVALTLSLVTLSNTKSHETEVRPGLDLQLDGSAHRSFTGDLCRWSRSSAISLG